MAYLRDSTKKCLRKILGQARLSGDEMHTAIIKIESILNSRPLSSADVEEPLTPSHLLVGRKLLSLLDDLTDLEDNNPILNCPSSLCKRRYGTFSVLNHFWCHCSFEHLLELRESHRCQAAKDRPPIKVGDVVLLEDQDKLLGFWRLVRVEKLLAGKDDNVRGAEIRSSTPTGQSPPLRRPVQALCPFTPLRTSSRKGHVAFRLRLQLL